MLQPGIVSQPDRLRRGERGRRIRPQDQDRSGERPEAAPNREGRPLDAERPALPLDGRQEPGQGCRIAQRGNPGLGAPGALRGASQWLEPQLRELHPAIVSHPHQEFAQPRGARGWRRAPGELLRRPAKAFTPRPLTRRLIALPGRPHLHLERRGAVLGGAPRLTPDEPGQQRGQQREQNPEPEGFVHDYRPTASWAVIRTTTAPSV